jgi:UDP-N-acetylmuramoyl-tripeptide--D-alanyl-D-alanine ligase
MVFIEEAEMGVIKGFKKPTPVWSLHEAATAIGSQFTGEDIPMPCQIFVDSRDVLPGGLFVALMGENADGQNFIEDAVKRGAAGLICRPPVPDSHLDRFLKSGVPAIVTRDTKSALRDLSLKWLDRINPALIIGITGTVGKTTTREMMKAVLADSLKVHSPRRSFNTDIGCAVTVLEAPPETEILLLELGTNRPGEIQELAQAYRPGLGVITEVGPGHLEGLKSIKGVLEAKLELLEAPSLKVLSYNFDNELLSRAIRDSGKMPELVPVGYRSTMYRILEARSDVQDGHPVLVVVVDTPTGKRKYQTELFGEHHAYGLAFASFVGDNLGIPPVEQEKRLSSFRTLPGRGNFFTSEKGFLIIDETYNANPVSMSAALRALAALPFSTNKCAVLGGMGELGEESPQWHRFMASSFQGLDHVLLIGKSWETVFRDELPANCHIAGFDDLEGFFRSRLSPGDLVLFKGSRSFHMEKAVKILENLR